MKRIVRFLTVISGGILLGLGALWTLAALDAASREVLVGVVLGAYALALLDVGLRLLRGLAGTVAYVLSIGLPILPISYALGRRLIEPPAFPGEEGWGWLALFVTPALCSLIALVLIRRDPDAHSLT